MKRFLFRYKTVLDVKKIREEVKQKEFSEVERLLREEEALLDYFISERGEAQSLLLRKLTSKLSGFELAIHQEYMHALIKAISNQEKKIAVIGQILEEKRTELIQASREKKVFENLEKRDYGNHRVLVALEEQKFLDDVTMTHYGKFNHERR